MQLADQRRVVLYDQYGCGLSDRATDPQEYDIELFIEEIDAVRSALGLEEVHLYAHSYGGPLAREYLLRRGSAGVRSLVLSNSFDSAAGLAAGWNRRIDEMPPDAAAALRAGAGVDPAAYYSALQEFVQRFVIHGEIPEPLQRSQEKCGEEVYQRMHGTSWFTPDGAWSAWAARVHRHSDARRRW